MKDKYFFYNVYWNYPLPYIYKVDLYSKINKIDPVIICFQDAVNSPEVSLIQIDKFVDTKILFFNRIKLWDSTINLITSYPFLDINKKNSDTANLFTWLNWELLAEAFFAKGDYKNAYLYLEAYKNYQKKIFG